MASISTLAVPVPNGKFLEHIFADTAKVLWVAAFNQDPSQAPPGAWGGAPYSLEEEIWSELDRQQARAGHSP